MGLIPAGKHGQLDRYVGYLEPYATSHDSFDADMAAQEDVKTAARSLLQAVKLLRAGKLPQPDAGLKDAIQK